jgi:hypothetical protein
MQDVTLFHSKWSPNLREIGHRRTVGVGTNRVGELLPCWSRSWYQLCHEGGLVFIKQNHLRRHMNTSRFHYKVPESLSNRHKNIEGPGCSE